LSNTNNDYTNKSDRTTIYRKSGNSERAIGYLDAGGIIYKLRWDEGIRVGHVTPDRHILRDTRYDERELGSFSAEGTVRSHGLFEGGELGWVDTDGTVVQAGMIFGEEEIGRVEGPDPIAAGAALLLLFFVDEQEETHRTNR
jgi:hypothetical protein